MTVTGARSIRVELRGESSSNDNVLEWMEVEDRFNMFSEGFQTTCSERLMQMSGGENKNGNDIFYLANNHYPHSVAALWKTWELYACSLLPDPETNILNSVTNQSDSSPLQSLIFTPHSVRQPCPHFHFDICLRLSVPPVFKLLFSHRAFVLCTDLSFTPRF